MPDDRQTQIRGIDTDRKAADIELGIEDANAARGQKPSENALVQKVDEVANVACV